MTQDQVSQEFAAFMASAPASEVNTPKGFLGKALQFFAANIGDMLKTLGTPEQVAAAAKAAVKTYLSPIDIPHIPNIVEPFFDAKVEELVEAAVFAIATRVHGG